MAHFPRHIHIPIFRIFYSSTYTFLLLLTLLLLAITPIDHAFQTLRDGKIGNVFVVSGAYILTALLSLFIYASRLYLNRTTLAAIPRAYLPVGEGEVPRKVGREIVRGRERSARIAGESRPRPVDVGVGGEEEGNGLVREKEAGRRGWNIDTSSLARLRSAGSNPNPNPDHNTNRTGNRQQQRLSRTANAGDPTTSTAITQPDITSPAQSKLPPWGHVSHPGWSIPTTSTSNNPSNPNPTSLDFTLLISELPHILEAAAVSTAGPDPAFAFLQKAYTDPTSGGIEVLLPPPDSRAVAKLQRAKGMSLRAYVAWLRGLDVLRTTMADEFLDLYEQARFGEAAVTEGQFETLMELFAEVLAGVGEGAGSMSIGDAVADGGESSESGSVRRAGLGQTHERQGLARSVVSKASMASLESTESVVRHVLT